MSSFKDRPKPIHRDYSLELVAEELRETILKTPPVDFESVRRARFGIWVMHRLMPRADTRGVQVRRVRLKARDRKTIRCRLYLPDRRDTGAIPGMLFMHWGGFVVGGLETEHARCVRLCREQQLAVLSVDYRKAPEHPFPTGLNDCFDALDWFHQNADSLGVSRNNIGVGGTSAGGGLAASLAVMTRDLDGPSVAWQYLGFPVLDSTCSTDSATRYVDTPNWTASSNLLMWQYYLNGQEPGIAAPLSLETLEGL
ncbi:MAG: alpha/beta hydrolase fold domain-containing protein, partial [Myxococcota bacterium]